MSHWFQQKFSGVSGKRLRTRTLSVVAGVLLLTLAFTSGVLAAPRVVPTVIYACVNHSNHFPRVITPDPNVRCASWEDKLNWNVQGPPGQQGPAGVQGPQGDRGPSNAFDFILPSGANVALNGQTTITSFSLAAGSYSITASVITFNASTTTAAQVSCFLNPLNISATQSAPPTDSSSGFSGGADVPMIGSVTIGAAGQTVTLVCLSNPNLPGVVIVDSARITAIQVANLQRNTLNPGH